MNLIKSAVISICFTAVAIGIIEAIAPKNTHTRQLRLLTGAILLLSLLTPLLSLSKAELKIPDFTQYSISDENALSSAAALAAKTDISQILSANGVKSAKIKIITDITEQGGINLNKAVITVLPADYENAVKSAEYIKNGIVSDVCVERNGDAQ